MTQNNVYTEPPPLASDVPLRIYSNPICPYVQRVRLLAAAKGVTTEEINIHLKVKPQWYLDKINPAGLVPTIEHDGKLIRESLIAFDYIDEVFGGDSVWPKDPYRKAHARLFVNDFENQFIPNYYKHYGGKQEESHTQAVVSFIGKIENGLKQHGDAGSSDKKPFLGGINGEPQAVDWIVWPWLERLEPMCNLNQTLQSLIIREKFPLFFDYTDRMKQQPAVKKTYLPPEAYTAFMKAMTETGKHDYSTVDITGNGVTIYTRKEE